MIEIKKLGIVYNGNLTAESFLWHVRKLAEEAEKLGWEAVLMPSSRFCAGYGAEGGLLGAPLEGIDPIIFLDKDLFLARKLEAMGKHVVNSPRAIEICDDKLLTYERLDRAGLPIPQTYALPKVFREVTDFEVYKQIGKTLGYPFIVKECFGSFGMQVYLIQSEAEFCAKAAELGSTPALAQKFIASSRGRDIRVIVTGGEAIGAIDRFSETDFRANVTIGGHTRPHILTGAEAELAVKAAETVGTAFAGVDLLYGENGDYFVCEVNSNLHFRGAMEALHKNIPRKILEASICCAK